MQCLRRYDTPHLSAENLTRKNSQPGFLNEESQKAISSPSTHTAWRPPDALSPVPPVFPTDQTLAAVFGSPRLTMVRTRSRPGLWKHGTPVSSRFMRLI